MITRRFNRGAVAQTGSIPTGATFLRDCYPLQVKDVKQIMLEGAGGKKAVLRITGIFQKADDQNQNGRIYPKNVLGRAVESIQEDLKNRCVMGEFDHPPDAKIHLSNVSHLITKVWMEGKYVYGEAEVLEDMPHGKSLAALMRAKVQVGISSRGVGDMEVIGEGTSDEKYVVQEGYEFVTWDVVGEPSVKEATMSMMESRTRGILTRAAIRKKNPEVALVNELDKWLRGK